ncbi:MAG: hypothetical protein ABL956_18135 [Hyphomonadaceae bacterium]
MVQIVYLKAGESTPDVRDYERWLTVEATSDGLFYGVGASLKPTGEWVGYSSLPEDDEDLERALKAAEVWAEHYNVPTIWVQASVN